MRVAYVTGSASRLAGGLFESVRRLAQSVRNQGAEVGVFATEDSYSDVDLKAWAPIEPVVSRRFGPARFCFAPRLPSRIERFALRDAVVHLHGLWQYGSIATDRARRHGHPTIISPRGMLDEWALEQSMLRKRIARALYEDRNLHGAACLHALTEGEYDTFRRLGLKNPVAVIPNGADLPTDADLSRPTKADLPEELRDKHVLLFMGRLHQKKGIDALIDAWATLGGETRDWRLAIVGPDEGGYRAQLEARIHALNVGDTVRLYDPQYGARKSAWLSLVDAFALPSRSEGMPLAVLEAMAHGLPTMLTSACHLPEAVASGAAIEVETNTPSLARGLRRMIGMTPEQRDEVSRRARDFIRAHHSWPCIASSMIEVYAWLLGRRLPPAEVRFT